MPRDTRRDVAAEARRELGVVERPSLALASEPLEVPSPFQAAIDELYTPSSTVVQFPYAAVHAECGRLVRGALVFIAANTGQGKTTFLLDVTDRWAEAGIVIDYLGTEQEPRELVTKWACLCADVSAGVALGKEWDEHLQGEAWRERVAAESERLERRFLEQVQFCPDKFITLPKVEQAARAAQARGAQVLIVDHVDRIDVGTGENEYTALKRLIRRLKELARDHSLVLVVASQMNREARKADRLGAYRPPQIHHMQGGGTKEQEADLVLGLWRPIRNANPDETAAEFKAKMAAAKAGAITANEVLEPNTMAVVLLKHRTHGNREGNRCKLHLQHGRLSDIAEKDQHGTSREELRRL